MCLIIYKKTAELVVPENIIAQTALENKDGFGITFLDTLQTCRTMNYSQAADMLREERPFIAHYRYATRGTVGKSMCHPYKFNKGWLFSNGTVDGLGSSTVCDTQVVAEFLGKTPKKYWRHLLSMTPTRFAVVEKTGVVTIHGNWIEKDGILYSKDVSVRKVHYYSGYTTGGKPAGSTYALTSTAGWQDKAPAQGIDEDYWEHEVVRKRLEEKEEGQKQLDEWLLRAQLAESDLTKTEIEQVVEFYSEEEEASAGVEEQGDPKDLAAFRQELRAHGMDHPDSFACLVECPDGNHYDAETGTQIPDYIIQDMSTAVYDYAMGYDDPFDTDSKTSAAGDKDETEWGAFEESWEDNTTVIVYGTLKRKRGNHKWLFGSDDLHDPTVFIGHGTTVENLRMTISGIPYVYPGESPKGHHLEVEVYDVPSLEARFNIDGLEGHPTHYTRRLTDVTLSNGNIITGWMYYIESDAPNNEKFHQSF